MNKPSAANKQTPRTAPYTYKQMMKDLGKTPEVRFYFLYFLIMHIALDSSRFVMFTMAILMLMHETPLPLFPNVTLLLLLLPLLFHPLVTLISTTWRTVTRRYYKDNAISGTHV